MRDALAAQQSAGPADVVDEVGRCLAGLDARPVAEHVDVYDRVSRLLQHALARLDEG